jgi:hypothetical protein
VLCLGRINCWLSELACRPSCSFVPCAAQVLSAKQGRSSQFSSQACYADSVCSKLLAAVLCRVGSTAGYLSLPACCPSCSFVPLARSCLPAQVLSAKQGRSSQFSSQARYAVSVMLKTTCCCVVSCPHQLLVVFARLPSLLLLCALCCSGAECQAGPQQPVFQPGMLC